MRWARNQRNTHLDLECQGINFKEKFYVFKKFNCSANGILGQNFFYKYKAIINYKDSTLSLNNKGENIIIDILDNYRFEHIIPPTKQNKDSVTLAKEIQPGVFIAGLITKPKDGKLPIRILNINDYEVCVDLSNLEVQNLSNFEICSIDENRNSADRVKCLLKSLNLPSYLNKEEQISIEKICAKYADVFHLPGDKMTVTNLLQHTIHLKENTPPVYSKPYRIPHALKGEMQKQIDEMLKNDIIEETTSEWSSPVLLVPKKVDKHGERKWRLVIDYRQLNKNICDDKFPLPNITDILDSLSGSIYFSKLDLSSSYYQLSLDKNSKTQLLQLTKMYQMNRCQMGLKTSSNVFSRLMTIALAGLNYNQTFVYLDDCIIIGKTLENHNKNLISVLERFREVNLKLNPIKCEFLRTEIVYLGHKITADGIYPDPEKPEILKKYPRPQNVDEIKRFVAFANYYRRFIPKFADIVYSLNSQCKKNAQYQWNDKCEAAFQTIKNSLISQPVLDYPDFSNQNTFQLQTDASRVGIGAILSNENGKVVAYASRNLKLLAIVWFIRHFRPYLYGKKIKVITDHKPLICLFSMTDPSSRLTKFRLYLKEYDFEIEYISGRHNVAADALSRITLKSKDFFVSFFY